MFSPIVMSLPTAVAAGALLVGAAWWWLRTLQQAHPLAFTPIYSDAQPASGRHRLGDNPSAYRPLAYRTTDGAVLPVVPGPADPDATEVVELPALPPLPAGVADYRQPLTAFEKAAGVLPMPVPAPEWRDAETATFERSEPMLISGHDDRDTDWTTTEAYTVALREDRLRAAEADTRELEAVS